MANVRDLGASVQVDVSKNSFTVRHEWEVEATRDALLAARQRLTLSGDAPIIGTPLVHSSTPVPKQNRGGFIVADAFRPVGAPEALGSTVTVTPNAGGMTCRVQGPVGHGQSDVFIGATEVKNGRPATRVTEVGQYSLEPGGSEAGLLATAARGMFRYTPMGRVALAMAHKAMGELHNAVFDAGGALAKAVR